MPTVYEVNSASAHQQLKGALLDTNVSKNKLGTTVTEYQYENIVEREIDLAPQVKDMNSK